MPCTRWRWDKGYQTRNARRCGSRRRGSWFIHMALSRI